MSVSQQALYPRDLLTPPSHMKSWSWMIYMDQNGYITSLLPAMLIILKGPGTHYGGAGSQTYYTPGIYQQIQL